MDVLVDVDDDVDDNKQMKTYFHSHGVNVKIFVTHLARKEEEERRLQCDQMLK